jgi:pSer/pThr/pTyr-binding forkhead associated (FHA) protein
VAGSRRYQLIDLGSANGTYVNGERLEPHVPRLLRQGDRLRLGRVVLEFRIR